MSNFTVLISLRYKVIK